MRYNVRFEHPLVGCKGDMVIVQLDAGSAEDALALAKEDTVFMGKIQEWQHPDYPIKDCYFHAYPAGNEKAEHVRVFEGDERL